MGTLLHLSDLHLADATTQIDVTGDYKVDALSFEHRQRRTTIIKNSLRELGKALHQDNVKLDAIVISGDVTVQGQSNGFELLPEVLGHLGDALPTEDRILIVPGNHDVAWKTDPGTKERYERFIRLRDFGYRTAYLDGVDIDFNGNLQDKSSPPLEPLIMAQDNSFVVVGINSTNHCGVRSDVEDSLQKHQELLETIKSEHTPAGMAIESLWAAWERRGLYDIARIDEGQRVICSEMVSSARRDIAKAGKAMPLLIATFHHQLRPVGGTEEFKPFEGITNLGDVRDWLACNKIDVLLHGHKHEERVLEDLFVPFHEPNSGTPHRLLIVSAPTIGHGQPADNDIGRLIQVDADMPRVADIKLTLVPARSAGALFVLDTLPQENFLVGNDDGLRLGLLEGKTAGEVYNKVLAVLPKLKSLPKPLIARFNDGRTGLELPGNYPDIGVSEDDMEAWFHDTIEWWERPVKGVVAPFNHGERIKSPRGKDTQFQTAISKLRSNCNTGAAIMIIVDPATDFCLPDTGFPAFTLVQMAIADGALSVTGYFRKQEMRHWWPINVAELATLQRDAIYELNEEGMTLEAGTICTVTAIPVAGGGSPRVVIPQIDRCLEVPGALLELVIPLYFSGASSPEMEAKWKKMIDDWRPTEQIAADGDPVPVVGLQHLHALADSCLKISGRDSNPDDPGSKLVDYLESLLQVNRSYAKEQERGKRTPGSHQSWRRSVDQLVWKILKTVRDLAAAAEGVR
jgi:predicted phosphodiesterase